MPYLRAAFAVCKRRKQMKKITNTATGIKLCELKERIYKTLGEYSANGVEIREFEYEKSDMEKKILMCINSAVTKAVEHLPMYTLSKEIYFPEIKEIYAKRNFVLPENHTLELPTEAECARFAFVVKCSGGFSVLQGNRTLYESKSDRGMEIAKHAFVFEASDEGVVTLSAGKGGLYVDVLYMADGNNFDLIESPENFPDYGMTFAKTNDDIMEITYAEHDGKSIPVYNYSAKDGYVYTGLKNYGKTMLHYTPKVHVFTEDSEEDEMLLLPEITVLAVVYLAASELCSLSDSAAFGNLSYKYREIALNCYDRQKEYSRNSFYGTSDRKLTEKGI